MIDRLATGWIQSYSGRKVSLLDPQPEDILIEDIARGLSYCNRYSGQSLFPYSVCTHSRHVSVLCEPHGYAKWGLLHDASEAYVGDVSRPLKALLPEYVAIEHRFMRVIADKFGLSWPEPPEVKWADVQMLINEKEVVLGPSPEDWNLPAKEVTVIVKREGPYIARRKFMERYEAVK